MQAIKNSIKIEVYSKSNSTLKKEKYCNKPLSSLKNMGNQQIKPKNIAKEKK